MNIMGMAQVANKDEAHESFVHWGIHTWNLLGGEGSEALGLDGLHDSGDTPP